VKQAKIGYLKNHLSKYVDHVRDGGEVVIYDRDTAVARIVPLAPSRSGGADQDRLARLERKGLIRRGQEPAGPAATRERRPSASAPSKARALATVPGSVLADLLHERGTSL
jgi:prevent-host-death family protein